MSDFSLKIEKILNKVSKPARYIGSEINAVSKDWDSAELRTVLVYPDIYDVGASNLGLQILYFLINKRDGWLAERSYLPWPDMIEAMRSEGLPLFSLESQRSVAQFDVVGITLQHELTFSNIPVLLKLGGIPVFSRDRDDTVPLVIGGGPSAYNPEPVADFFDAFIIGEAEDAVIEFLEVLKEHKPATIGRRRCLEKLAAISGVYVPSFYEAEYDDGRFRALRSINAAAPASITRRVIDDIDRLDIPHVPIIPYVEVVHDRDSVEIMRGCTRGCRFCQAGMIYRPVRERSVDSIVSAVTGIIDNSGYDEVSMASLSSADFSQIDLLMKRLSDTADKDKVVISLPSLRVDTFSVDLAARLGAIRKSGLTFAPEAGTQRLRNVINKCVTDEDIEMTMAKVFENGWQKVKLYFMIGLPTETDEDVLGIASTAKRIKSLAFNILPKSKHGRLNITVSVSNYVPKPHTPFQWYGSGSMEELLRKQDMLKQALRIAHIKFKWHDAEQSVFEAALARGDRRLSRILAEGSDRGLILDAWSDMFAYYGWQPVFADAGLNIEELATAVFDIHDALPWDHIDSGIDKKWLLEERDKAITGVTTPDCRNGCTGCGLCARLGVDMIMGDVS